jgi:predicted transcriptional regulator
MSKIIRITQKSYEQLSQLEQESGCSKQAIIEQAIEQLSREKFMDEVVKAYERLRSDEKAWKEELEERAEWEMINDGLEDL